MNKVERDVESRIREFYDSEGWVRGDDGKTQEDRFFRSFGRGRAGYNARVRRRTVSQFEGRNGVLLIAGGGDLPESHIQVAAQFNAVVCVDISWRALALNEEKLGAKGQYHLGSILEIPLADASVDAALCAHVLYHVDARDQERAVRELIRVTRPGGRVVILYMNPRAPLNLTQSILKRLSFNRMGRKADLYKYVYPLSWWRRFENVATVRLLPSDVMSTAQSQALRLDNAIGTRFFEWAARFEDAAPRVALKLWGYPVIVLDPKPSASIR